MSSAGNTATNSAYSELDMLRQQLAVMQRISELEAQAQAARVDHHAQADRVDHHGQAARVDHHAQAARVDHHGQAARVDHHGQAARVDHHAQPGEHLCMSEGCNNTPQEKHHRKCYLCYCEENGFALPCALCGYKEANLLNNKCKRCNAGRLCIGTDRAPCPRTIPLHADWTHQRCSHCHKQASNLPCPSSCWYCPPSVIGTEPNVGPPPKASFGSFWPTPNEAAAELVAEPVAESVAESAAEPKPKPTFAAKAKAKPKAKPKPKATSTSMSTSASASASASAPEPSPCAKRYAKPPADPDNAWNDSSDDEDGGSEAGLDRLVAWTKARNGK